MSSGLDRGSAAVELKLRVAEYTQSTHKVHLYELTGREERAGQRRTIL
jgi:hypothetical protein